MPRTIKEAFSHLYPKLLLHGVGGALPFLCTDEPGKASRDERRVLLLALFLNAAMFAIGIVAGIAAKSSGLIADSLDMLADAGAYWIALAAIRRGEIFKVRAATISGTLLFLLGMGVLFDAIHRGLLRSSPQTGVMLAVATLSLIVNSTVLYLLGRFRHNAVHMQATWIFTRADVIANIAVILSGLVIFLTRFNLVDSIVGAGIGLYVMKEAVEILKKARSASPSRL